MRHLVRTAALVLGVSASGSLMARADSSTFDSFVTSNTPEGIITTTLPSSPTPDSFTSTSFQLTVPLIIDGDPMTLPVDFYTAAGGGGAAGDGMRFAGPVLFSGPTSAPTFLTGTFNFGDFTLTISPSPVTPVPEPATFVLFGTGALLLAAFGRRFLIRTKSRLANTIK
jgi:PEP-CTERM motif